MSISENRLSPAEIESLKTKAFEIHSNQVDYPTYRSAAEYSEQLPKLEAKDCLEHIEGLAQRNKRVNVLDIGCGQGNFLAYLTRYIPQVYGYGISAHDYRPQSIHYVEPTKVERVDYRVGDAHNLSATFSDVRFDVVVSLYALEYMGDPQSVIKQAYTLTREGGFLFLDQFFPFLTMGEESKLADVWMKRGLRFNLKRFAPRYPSYDPALYELAIKRGADSNLPLPFVPSGVHTYPSLCEGVEEEKRLDYRFDPLAAES